MAIDDFEVADDVHILSTAPVVVRLLSRTSIRTPGVSAIGDRGTVGQCWLLEGGP